MAGATPRTISQPKALAVALVLSSLILAMTIRCAVIAFASSRNTKESSPSLSCEDPNFDHFNFDESDRGDEDDVSWLNNCYRDNVFNYR
jgi:hypothetical protein